MDDADSDTKADTTTYADANDTITVRGELKIAICHQGSPKNYMFYLFIYYYFIYIFN